MRLAIPLGLIGALVLGGCAVAPPPGPSVMAMPGKDKTFEAFQADDAACRQHAAAQVGYATPQEAANDTAASSAAVGTVLGAAAGAAIGAATGNPAAGAAIGAGSGLFLGGASGLSAANASSYSVQRNYDIAYVQCMAAKGENVPNLAAAPGYAYSGSVYPGYGAYPGYTTYSYGYSYYPYPYYGPSYYPYYPSAFVGARFGFGGHHHHFRGGRRR